MTMPPSIGLGPTTSVYSVDLATDPWPDPVVPNEETQDYMGKRAVVDLVKQAQQNGWNVRVTKARGSYPSTGKKPSRPRWSLAVRMSRGEDRAVAVYVEGPSEGATWAWDTLYRWRLGETPAKFSTITPFLAVV